MKNEIAPFKLRCVAKKADMLLMFVVSFQPASILI
jgi:hypothetical protein